MPAADHEISPLAVDVHSVYQPIVTLDTRTLVGFEALCRPPSGAPWTTPDEMFAAAVRRRETAAFDWNCRMRAIDGALTAGLPSDLVLFVNAEPTALDAPAPERARGLIAQSRELSITVEITERHLMGDPAGLLRAVEQARDLGWRIAVDDVGADSSSLALLALLRPDVIKLDMRLIHEGPTRRTASILAAVTAESERTGAVVLAEGIETEGHEAWARDAGAVWGQGWLYGAAEALPLYPRAERAVAAPAVDAAVTIRAPVGITPFGLARTGFSPRRLPPGVVDAIEEDLLHRAGATGSTTIVLVTAPTDAEVSDQRRALLAELASRCALVVLFHVGADGSAGRYRHVSVDPAEPLACERSIVVLDPMFAGALIAVDRGRGTHGARIHDCRLTFDRDAVLDAATVLLRRLPSAAIAQSDAR